MKYTAENGAVIFELKAVQIDKQANDDQTNDAFPNQYLILGIVILSVTLMGVVISILILKKKKARQEIESQKQIKTQEFCKHCGEMINAQDNFCDNCGKPLIKK